MIQHKVTNNVTKYESTFRLKMVFEKVDGYNHWVSQLDYEPLMGI